MIMSAVKRIPVTEHMWRELSEMRLAGQTYAELREDLIADRKKPGGGSRENLEIKEKKRVMYCFHLLGIALCVHSLERLADEVNNLPDKIHRIIRLALVRLKENPFPVRSDKKPGLTGGLSGPGHFSGRPVYQPGVTGRHGLRDRDPASGLGAVSPRMRQ